MEVAEHERLAGSVGVGCMLHSYRFGCIINHFPDIVSDPDSENWYMSEGVDISGCSDGSPLRMIIPSQQVSGIDHTYLIGEQSLNLGLITACYNFHHNILFLAELIKLLFLIHKSITCF